MTQVKVTQKNTTSVKKYLVLNVLKYSGGKSTQLSYLSKSKKLILYINPLTLSTPACMIYR